GNTLDGKLACNIVLPASFGINGGDHKFRSGILFYRKKVVALKMPYQLGIGGRISKICNGNGAGIQPEAAVLQRIVLHVQGTGGDINVAGMLAGYLAGGPYQLAVPAVYRKGRYVGSGNRAAFSGPA